MALIPQSHAHPSLEGRIVLITGGGRGLGREMALALVQAGSKVVVTAAREVSELAAVEAEANDLPGPGELMAIRADIADEADCARVVGEVIEAHGTIHGLYS